MNNCVYGKKFTDDNRKRSVITNLSTWSSRRTQKWQPKSANHTLCWRSINFLRYMLLSIFILFDFYVICDANFDCKDTHFFVNREKKWHVVWQNVKRPPKDRRKVMDWLCWKWIVCVLVLVQVSSGWVPVQLLCLQRRHKEPTKKSRRKQVLQNSNNLRDIYQATCAKNAQVIILGSMVVVAKNATTAKLFTWRGLVVVAKYTTTTIRSYVQNLHIPLRITCKKMHMFWECIQQKNIIFWWLYS